MITTKALVIRRSDWRDYDRMVTLLSPDMGRVEAVVRGCRRPRSPLMNAAEPFCAGEYTLVESKGRYTVTSCQVQESNFPIREDPDKFIHAAYYLHLIGLAALPGEESGDLFQLALKALAFLSYSSLPPELTTAAFELHYLGLMGQAPRMDHCVVCAREVSALAGSSGANGTSGPTSFSARLGGAVCLSCASAAREPLSPLSEGARRILLKVPKTRFDVIDKLLGHADWPEAAAHARRFISERMEQFPKTLPKLVTGDHP
jgi:DNA repair protein RecO (recombination protein O)